LARQNKEKDLDLGRLCVAMQRSRLVMRRQREIRTDMVRACAGPYWGADTVPQQSQPINLLSLYDQVYGSLLVPKNPRVMLSTFDKSSKPIISAEETWANKYIEDINLANTIQRVVRDAFYSFGVCKVALATPADSANTAWSIGAGDVMIEPVDPDDFVCDVHARDKRNFGFVGHRFRVPLEVVRQSKEYGKGRKQLEATDDKLFNLEGDERISVMGRGYYADTEEYEDFIDLWEIYLPRHKVIVTLADDYIAGAEDKKAGEYGARALKVQRWIGPDCGPYHILGYKMIPGNWCPKGPMQDLYDLHLAINNICRKVIEQARRSKHVTFVAGGADADGKRLIECNDGDVVRIDNPESLKHIVTDQPDQMIGQLMEQLGGHFNKLAGNLDILAGLGPQSKTATQDTMLNANSSRGVTDMQDITISYTADILRAAIWFHHHHPTKTMKSKFALPGLPQFSIVRQVTPQQRAQASWDDIDIKIDPYSMQHQTPQMRLAMLNQVVTTVVIPQLQTLQAQGVAFDMNAFLKKIAKYMDMPDLEEIITMREPPEQQSSQGPSDQMGAPAQKKTEITRRSVGGDSQQAKEALASNMRSAKPTNGQMNGTPQGMVQ
jgi:hypothetical protein